MNNIMQADHDTIQANHETMQAEHDTMHAEHDTMQADNGTMQSATSSAATPIATTSTTTPLALTPLTTTTSAVKRDIQENSFDDKLEEDYKFIVENLCYGNALERLTNYKFSNYGDALIKASINIAEFQQYEWGIKYPFFTETSQIKIREVSKKEMVDVENLLKTMSDNKYAVCILGYLYDKLERYQEGTRHVLQSLEMGCIETLSYITEMLSENMITFNPNNKTKSYIEQSYILKVLGNLSNEKLQIIIGHSKKYSSYLCISTLLRIIMQKNKQINHLQNLATGKRE